MSSYSNAMSQCGEGYSADYIAEIVVVKTETACRLVNRDRFVFEMGSLRPLIGAGLVPCQQKIRVLDFGGAAGLHYFTTRHFLPPGTALEWHVVETPSMVRQADRLSNSELSFYSSLSDATQSWSHPPDLVIASGVLQYLPDPLFSLAELVSLQAPALFVTRTGLSPDDLTRVTIQRSSLSAHGVGPLPTGIVERRVNFPVTFVPELAFEQVIESRYRIVARINEDVGAYSVGKVQIDMHGYACRLIKTDCS